MKRSIRFLLPFLFLIAAVTGAGTTTAYLSDLEAKDNAFQIGSNVTGITEDFPETTPVPPGEDPVFRKKVQIRSAALGGANADCYVRARISFSNAEIGRAVVIQGMDTSSWTLLPDGYYYYIPVLKEGQATSPLMEAFSIDSRAVDPELLPYLTDFRISIYEESIQAEGFSDYKEAWSSFRTFPGSRRGEGSA